ncbi:hypothetical protein FGG08_002621 [Glutinoglossum americanum]|uniref:Uncharacterized protein n=1 Tax=Glutinoglossum americanum TaxID=1670608 RepID=A0A9P8L4B5_9PEZI|nr:hypothetical protein FGG08_002621 [Glutinoglossum americanum]
MTTQGPPENGGGFFPLTLPLSPAPTAATSTQDNILPFPRSHPLKPGSAKETAFIQYVDKGILEVTRRYAKKFSGEFGGEGGRGDGTSASPNTAPVVQSPVGYESIRDVCTDLEKLVDVIWVSGTPSLQVQYLLSVALLLTSYLPSFPASPRPTFRLLGKLDTAFASLLVKVSTTDMVRLKSLVERTRVVVVDVMGRWEVLEGREGKNSDDGHREEDESEDMGDQEEGDGRWEMEVARVYERTIVELGELLGNSGGGALRLEGPQRAEDKFVLPEESLTESGGLEFLGERQDMPFFLVRAGKDLFKAKQGTNRNNNHTALMEPSHKAKLLEIASAVAKRLEMATALTPGAEPATYDQKADRREGQSPEARRSSFGRVIKQKGSLSPFSVSSRRPTFAQPNPTGAGTAATDSVSPLASIPLRSSQMMVRPEMLESGASADMPITPLPLTLTVTLNPPSWIVDPSKKIYSQDVKVDIFFNGEFTASRVIPARHREAGWGRVSEVFSGRRVTLRQERVWVLVPPGQNAHSKLREPKRAKKALHPAAERWAEIGKALQEESDRWGQNIWGERSCVGEYLEYLAKSVELPKGLEEMQKSGGQKFGVIDVVVCLGNVGKRDTLYLRAPERSTDPRFPNLSGEGSEEIKHLESATINQTSQIQQAASPTKRIAGSNDEFELQDPSSPYSTNQVFTIPKRPLPSSRRSTPKSSSASVFRHSAGRIKASVPKPKNPFSTLTPIPDPVQPKKKYSAEQNRRLQDLTPMPVRPRLGSVVISANISHGHPTPISTSSTPITPSVQDISDKTRFDSTERTPQHTPAPKSGIGARGRSRPGGAGGDDSPGGKPEILPQKRYRYADGQPQETPVKKRKSKMDDLSTTLNESIWGVGAMATKYGVTPADAPALSTRSRGRSRSAAPPDRPSFEATPDFLTRSSRSSPREVEPQTLTPTPYHINLKANDNTSSSTPSTASRIAEPNPFPTMGPRIVHSRPSAAIAPTDRSTANIQLNDPFYSPLPTAGDVPWKPNSLSQDAVITYAEDGAWEGPADQQIQRVLSDIPAKKGDVAYRGEKMDGVREVKMERLASFEEEGVLMGVRFVVG